MGPQEEEIVSKINYLQGFTLTERCRHIHQILEKSTLKELEVVFPVLVVNIFGIDDHIGWGVRSIFRHDNNRDFECLFAFLHPTGPLFQACYRLLEKSYKKFEYPLNFLPAKLNQMIIDGQNVPFYVNKVQVDFHTRQPVCLLLNSFEYYMFHFAFYLIDPWLVKLTQTWNLWDTPYLSLVEAYLEHYLPCEGNVNTSYSGLTVPVTPVPLQISPSRQERTPTLLKSSVLLNHSEMPAMPTLPQQKQSVVEVWWSETLLNVFLDFYLNFGESDTTQYYNIQNKTTLPCMEHVRIVRNLVKYLHFFANSATVEMSVMNELKRNVYASSQGKVYKFLRQLISKWPLDSSFRVVIETWLSFIRPWRYQDFRTRVSIKDEERLQIIDSRWIDFVAENLLAYTVLFQQLIPRFSRMDLTSPRNASLLFRVTKVFAQENLHRLLRDIEKSLEMPKTEAHIRSSMLGHGHKWMALVRHQILELEGSDFHYRYMFGNESTCEILEFINTVQKLAAKVQVNLEMEEQDKKNNSFSFVQFVKNIFKSDPDHNDEYSAEDKRKTVCWLRTCVRNLLNIYGIRENLVVNFEDCVQQFRNSSTTCSTQESLYHSAQSSFLDQSLQLSPNKSFSPLSMQLRRRKIEYEGDPDLEPIRSTENAFLVRLLYQFSSKLNETYSVDLHNLYYRNDMWGRMARQIIQPPREIYTFDKECYSGMHSPRQRSLLPPRLSFRKLASHKMLVMFILFFSFMWIVFGSGPVPSFFLITLIFAVKIFVYAVFQTLFSHYSSNTMNASTGQNAH